MGRNKEGLIFICYTPEAIESRTKRPLASGDVKGGARLDDVLHHYITGNHSKEGRAEDTLSLNYCNDGSCPGADYNLR